MAWGNVAPQIRAMGAKPGTGQTFADFAMGQYPGYEASWNEGMAIAPQTGLWTNLAKRQQNLKQLEAIEDVQDKVGGEMATARTRLAAQGGLSSGARERIAQGGVKSGIDARQGIHREGMDNLLAIDTKGEENRLTAMGQDVANKANEGARKNDYNMRAYEAQMGAQAAERQAQATENSGKK